MGEKGTLFDRFGVDFGTVLGSFRDMGRIVKVMKNQFFSLFFAILRCWHGLLTYLASCFESSRLQDGIFEVISRICYDMLAPRWRLRAPR